MDDFGENDREGGGKEHKAMQPFNCFLVFSSSVFRLGGWW